MRPPTYDFVAEMLWGLATTIAIMALLILLANVLFSETNLVMLVKKIVALWALSVAVRFLAQRYTHPVH